VTGAAVRLTDLDLFVDLRHTFAADLDTTLMSPAGTIATITTDNGAGNDNTFAGTTFDDQANPGGQVPYTTNAGMTTDNPYANLQAATTLTPEEPLAAFHGENPNGTWTVTISDDLAGDGGELQSWRLDIQGLAAAPDTSVASSSSAAPVGVPAGPAVVTSTIEVAGAGAYLADLDLGVDLPHTFAADLDITLMSPAGTIATITTDNGAGNNDTFAGTTFDDQANPGGQAPYTTNAGMTTDNPYANLQAATQLTPEEPLAAFHGENPNGTWTLTISDDLAGDGGELRSWQLDVTTASCPPPPEPPKPAQPAAGKPAATAESVPGPTLSVAVGRVSVFAGAVARCRGAQGDCRVRVRADGRVIARGTSGEVRVPLRLTRAGRRLLERSFGGVRARVLARDDAGRARARTRAILRVERITTPSGSFVADQAELTSTGGRFVRSLRDRLIRVASLHCHGHTAKPEAHPQPELATELSLARAAVVCGKDARLVAHGSADPIASNADEAGRAANRRVEVIVRH
jgi:subtilisin-like proprotein convertase family protein